MQRLIALVLLSLLATASCRSAGGTGAPTLVQPGAPGEPARTVSAAEAVGPAAKVSDADVRFMQDMLVHHAQAVEMTTLLRTRTARDDMRLLAGRIEASQDDEMAFMRRWLETRGLDVPGAHAAHDHGAAPMPGMLSPQEMERLAAVRGPAFDRLFLEGMIKHHAGALEMVARLFATPGAAQETEIFGFASDVDADQRIEIARMEGMWLDSTKSR